MNKEDKLTFITGYMFISIFFTLMIMEVFITKAAAYATFISLLTFIFFDDFYYEKTEY